jgi:threonine/homoserine/homoserine lactone efflux protein
MLTSIFAFLVFLFFWNISPGPMVMLTSRNAVKYSFKGGFAIVCGILICDVIYLSLSFLGISAFIIKYEIVFNYAKIIGGCYIFYIGLNILWDSRKKKDYTSTEGLSSDFNFKREVLKGFLTNLSNPFTIVGMTSFILPFFKPEMSLETRVLFAILVPFSTLYCFCGISLIFGNKISRNFILPKIIWFERIAGVVICYMSIMMIFFD